MLQAKTRPDRRYTLPNPHEKLTDETILAQIPHGSRVVDLGCGDGRLLERLREAHGASVQGVELNPQAVLLAMERGVPIIQADLDRGLHDIPDGVFDIAVLSQTLQQVRHPRQVLREMLRVARQALIVVPNYGHWRVRWELLCYGRAPKTHALPYEWYETPNLHFMSIVDFRDIVDHIGARIVKELPLVQGRVMKSSWAANLRADSALYIIERKEDAQLVATDLSQPAG